MLIFLLMAMSFFGIVRFPNEGKKKFSFLKVSFTVLFFSTIYLVKGLTKNAHLKLLPGFPPPIFYSIYAQESDCLLRLDCFRDFDEDVAFVKSNIKPILLDFTDRVCINCRKMEENV